MEPIMTDTAHPCDPLSGDEMIKAARIVRELGGLDASAWFETLAPDEPDKAHLKTFRPGDPIRRRVFVACYEPSSNRTFDGVVDLAAGKLISWRHIPGAQPRIGGDEFVMGGEIAKADPQFRAACARRGIDPDKVLVEPWAAGNFGVAGEAGERIAYGHCWLPNDSGDNPYGRPIANLHPVIDLRRRKVLRVDDFGVLPVPPDSGDIVSREGFRTDLKPLEITQKDGPSFSVDGHHVRWQKWNLRIGFNGREGLHLYEIGYQDNGRVRPIMHRASLAEMVVPYGDPNGGNFRRNAFDVGEYGVGQLVDSLVLGCDCLGAIHYFDAWTHDWHGKPKFIQHAICMHEEDFGILWKFNYWGTVAKRPNVARSRRLVISSFSTIGNYVYGFFWYFYQDGTIGVEVKATGIPFPTGTRVGEPGSHGEAMAEGISGHVHQHTFSYRFDMAVDGDQNAVREVNFSAAPKGPANPQGNAIVTEVKPLVTELAAQREMDMAAARYWMVINPNSLNAHGKPVGYKLVPGSNALPFLQPDAPVGKRAAFMFKHFWATQYERSELYPAGWYPNQHEGGDGLPAWTAKDRPLENQNVVVWYTLNYHHLPRPEDWPVQPVVYANFHWMPVGFFDRNPALDVPTGGAAECC